MILPGHGPVAPRIDEFRPADRFFMHSFSRGKPDDLVGKAMGEMKDRIGGVQPVFEIGNQEGRKKMAESAFGEKAQGRVLGIEDGGIHVLPLGESFERCHSLTWFTSFRTPLQERVARVVRFVERLANHRDDVGFVRHIVQRASNRGRELGSFFVMSR